MGSLVAAPGLSCPAACGILVPRPGIEPMFPALEGGFLTTGPPGKSIQGDFEDTTLPSTLVSQSLIFFQEALAAYHTTGALFSPWSIRLV